MPDEIIKINWNRNKTLCSICCRCIIYVLFTRLPTFSFVFYRYAFTPFTHHKREKEEKLSETKLIVIKIEWKKKKLKWFPSICIWMNEKNKNLNSRKRTRCWSLCCADFQQHIISALIVKFRCLFDDYFFPCLEFLYYCQNEISIFCMRRAKGKKKKNLFSLVHVTSHFLLTHLHICEHTIENTICDE